MQKVLLTGDKGLIATDFTETFGKKFAIASPEETDWKNYAQTAAILVDTRYDAVVHFVAPRETPSDSWLDSDELVAFTNVQYASVLFGVKKLIVVSDPYDLDTSEELVRVAEETFGVSMPRSGVGRTRYLITKLASSDKISTVLRVFGAYGKGARVNKHRLTEILSHAITGKKQIELPANKTFSAVYAEDVARLIALFLEEELPKGVYNVANPAPTSLSEYAKKVKAYAKKNEREIEIVSEKAVLPECTASTDKLNETVGSFKFTSLGTGINKTLDYYKAHKGKLRREKGESET